MKYVIAVKKYMAELMKFILLFLFIPFSLISQISGPGATLTLQECINIALEKNYDLLISEERVNVAEAGLRSAFGEYLPTISANIGYNRQLNNLSQSLVFGDRVIQSNQNPNRYNASTGARLTLFDGFAREYNYSSSKDNLESVKFNLEQLKRDIKIQIYRAFTEVIRNSQIVRIRKENIEVGKIDLEKMKAQYKAGVTALPVIYSQEAELGNLEYELLTAENNQFNSKANLLILMGLSPDLDVKFDVNSIPSEVTQKDVDSFYNNHNDERELIRKALNNRYDIKSYDMSGNAAKSAKKAVEGSYFPNISASTGWTWANTEITEFNTRGNFAVGLNLNIPIFNNFRTDQQVQNAELQLKQAEIEKQRLENRVRNEVKTTLLNLEISQKQLQVSEKSYQSSLKNNESTKERYRVGAATLLELQKSNTQFINSQLNKVNAAYNYFKAKRELLYAIGVEQ